MSHSSPEKALHHFLEAVEFPALLKELSLGCQTPAGKTTLLAFHPLTDPIQIGEKILKTRELEQHIIKDAPPSIPDSQRFYKAFEAAQSQGQVFSGEELSSLADFLEAVIRLRRYLSPDRGIPPSFQEWLTRLNALPELKELIRSQVSSKGEMVDDASPELKSLRDQLRNLRSEIQEFFQGFLQQAEAETIFQDRLVTEREGRMVVPVKRERQSFVPGFVHGVSASGSTLFIEPQATVENNNRVKEILMREDEEIRRILRELTQKVIAAAGELKITLQVCAEIDSHSALAMFASLFDAQFLTPDAAAPLVLKNARHPLLSLEAGEKFRGKIVPLDLEYGGEVRIILVSGPNAGGKTVALKTLGLTCAMALSGMPVIASGQSTIPLFKHFDTDLTDGQSLMDHMSTYAAKLTALKRMLDHAEPPCLFLLDELGAGTDPLEGGALGLACLESFREKGAFVLGNTHQPILKLLTQEEQGMANAAMLLDEVSGKPTFKLVSGVPGRSYAFTLAKQIGFPETIMERAKAHLPAGEADLSEVLSKLALEMQLAEKARIDSERTREKVKKMEVELETARRQIKDEAKRIKKEAQIEAEGLLKNTRRQMEHLIQGVGKKPGTPPPVVNRDRVRNAKEEVNRNLRNIAPRPERVILEIRELTAGESVHFKPGKCKVLVVSADDDKSEAIIQMENGLKLSCKYSDLGHMTDQLKPAPLPRPQATGVMSSQAMAEKGKLEVDVRGKMVDQALPIIDKFIDDALLVALPFVRIIHGKGTGALKEAIHKHLPVSHPSVTFNLAEPAQGGAGVTVIKFKPS